MFFYESNDYEDENYYHAFSFQEKSFPLHFHRAFELVFVEQGQLKLDLDQKTYRLQSGEAAFLFPHQLHAYTVLIPSVITIIMFSPELVGHFSTHYRNLLPQNPILKIALPPAEQLQFKGLYQKKSFLYGICAALTDSTGFYQVSLSGSGQTPLHQILSYIESHYQEHCDLAHIAAELGYDYTYLSRMFKKKMGVSFTGYLNQYRIGQACRLLDNTQDPVSSIALQCGYNTIRSFNRNFLKLTGCSPQKHREFLPTNSTNRLTMASNTVILKGDQIIRKGDNNMTINTYNSNVQLKNQKFVSRDIVG